ncbi:hypothetical protein [Jannaschia sp. R86511]|uniref:hypothetical protein n=1 Tax=Jannaschia sp. R86511 TaxID=3093853 RepID=UPI0036D40926
MGVSTEPTAYPTVPARRVRRPSWRDPRLLVGLVLVLGATALGGVLVAQADDTVPVLAAGSTVVRGDTLEQADLQVVRVRLGDAGAAYVAAADALPADSVALRTVPAGELVPASAVGRADELEARPVALPWQGPRPEGLVRGAAVDLWVAPREGTSEFGEPDLLVASADVFAVVEGSTGLGATGGAQVQVMLEPDGVRALLAALAAEDRIDLVLVPGPRG